MNSFTAALQQPLIRTPLVHLQQHWLPLSPSLSDGTNTLCIFQSGPVICRSQPTAFVDFIVLCIPRGFILSLSAPFSCSSRRCNFVLLGAPLPFISSDASSSASPHWLASKKLAESQRRCQSRAGSQSHRNLSAAPAASPPHIHFSSALLPTDALLDFSSHLSHMSLFFSVYFPISTKQQLLNRRLLPPFLTFFFFKLTSSLGPNRRGRSHRILVVFWPTPGQFPKEELM